MNMNIFIIPTEDSSTVTRDFFVIISVSFYYLLVFTGNISMLSSVLMLPWIVHINIKNDYTDIPAH